MPKSTLLFYTEKPALNVGIHCFLNTKSDDHKI